MVANITTNSEELTAADISSTTSILDQLTISAIADPEVRNSIIELITEYVISGQRCIFPDH